MDPFKEYNRSLQLDCEGCGEREIEDYHVLCAYPVL